MKKILNMEQWETKQIMAYSIGYCASIFKKLFLSTLLNDMKNVF